MGFVVPSKGAKIRGRGHARSIIPAHVLQAAGATSTPADTSGTSATVCRFFASGDCRRGLSCKFVHATPTGAPSAPRPSAAATPSPPPLPPHWVEVPSGEGGSYRRSEQTDKRVWERPTAAAPDATPASAFAPPAAVPADAAAPEPVKPPKLKRVPTDERDVTQALGALHIYVSEQGGAISPGTGVPGLETFYVHASTDGPRFKAAIKSVGVKRLLDQRPRGSLRYDASGANPGQHRIRSIVAQQGAPSAGNGSGNSNGAGSGGGPSSSRPSATPEDAEAERKLVARTVRQQEAESAMRRREATERKQAMRAQLTTDLRQTPPLILAGQEHAAVPKAEERQRRFFDKAVKTANFTFKNERDAERFAEAVENYGENDLPWRLSRRDEYGLKRMIDAAQTAGVNATMAMVRSLMVSKFSLFRSPRWLHHPAALPAASWWGGRVPR